MQSPSTVIWEPKKTMCHCFHFSPTIAAKWWDPYSDLSFLDMSFKPDFSLSSFSLLIKRPLVPLLLSSTLEWYYLLIWGYLDIWDNTPLISSFSQKLFKNAMDLEPKCSCVCPSGLSGLEVRMVWKLFLQNQVNNSRIECNSINVWVRRVHQTEEAIKSLMLTRNGFKWYYLVSFLSLK